MAKNIRRILAMVLVMVMFASALPMQALAAETVHTTETSPENLTTDVYTTRDEDGKETIVVKFTEGTYTDEDGKEIALNREESEVTATTEEPDGSTTTVVVESGTETTVEVVPSGDEISVDVIVDGEVQEDASGSSETADVIVSGDIKTDDEDPEYDQTTVTTTDRTAQVDVTKITVSTGDVIYVDADGNIVGNSGDDDGFNYYWSDIYTVNGGSVIDDGAGPWKTGTAYIYVVDSEGNKEQVLKEGVCQRVVAHDNGTPDDYSDDYEVGGLYCVDFSTGIKEYLKYRKANLEDAEYYSEEDISHLRAIMTYGYTWDDDNDDNGVNGDENLANIIAMLQDAQANGDESTKAMLDGYDFSDLTREQAATATGLAVWHYGNRAELGDGEMLYATSYNAKVDAVYNYLITLTKEADENETQIINEEKFVEDMELVVGGMVDDNEANTDDDDTNDVYNVDLKFSLVVEPSKTDDDLIVKVVDSEGHVVKTARIAGSQKDGETFGYAQTTTDENGKTYYLLEDLQLSENSNTTFNLKLEGTQLLEEGVYIFESEHKTRDEIRDRMLMAWGSEEAVLAYANDNNQGRHYDTIEEYVDYLEAADELDSQNFIGKYEGTAEVDVSLEINLTFDVEEATVTTERIWRSESVEEPIETPEEPEEDPPVIFRLDPETEEEIPEEPVPLAAPVVTGDNSFLWIVVVMIALCGVVAINVSDKKKAI